MLYPAEFLQGRICCGHTIKCCVAAINRMETAGSLVTDDDAAASMSTAIANVADAAATATTSTAIANVYCTAPQPLFSQVTWEQLDDDDFVIKPRSQCISVNYKPQTPFK